MKKWTTTAITKCKGQEKVVTITAYDAAFARIFDSAGIHAILVGDSVGNNVLGFDNTLPVTMDMMVHHTAAVARGVKDTHVIADMPFLSYQINDDEAMRNAGRLIQEGGADSVKLEGGEERAALVARMVANGIPVCAHIGLTPQSVLAFGGYGMHGKSDEEAEALKRGAKALADAGAFAIVLECVPDTLAAEITAHIPIPTIGIGAGPHCDGQILVMHDLLGINPPDRAPRFAKRYAEIGAAAGAAIRDYIAEVQSGAFPKERTKHA